MSKAVSGSEKLTSGGSDRNLCRKLSHEVMGLSTITKTCASVEAHRRCWAVRQESSLHRGAL